MIFHCWSVFQGNVWSLTVSFKEALSCSAVFGRFCVRNVLFWMLFDLVKAGLYLSISRPIILNISLLYLKSKSNVQLLVFILCGYLFSDFSIFLLLQTPLHCFQIFSNPFSFQTSIQGGKF